LIALGPHRRLLRQRDQSLHYESDYHVWLLKIFIFCCV
jgi:hypothetical protein